MFIDTHCHLTKDFDSDLKEVIERAISSNILKMISMGTDLKTSNEVLSITSQYDSVYGAIGIHPEDCLILEENQILEELKEIDNNLENEKIVAVGEIGLDKRWIETEILTHSEIRNWKSWAMERQQFVLRKELDLALDHNLPVVIHCREAEKEIYEILSEFTQNGGRGVLHSFTGDVEFLKEFLNKGWFVSFNGIITFKNAENVRNLCRESSIEQIVIETDAPFLSPSPERGRRCEPKDVIRVAEELSEIKGIGIEELEEILEHNSNVLFPKL